VLLQWTVRRLDRRGAWQLRCSLGALRPSLSTGLPYRGLRREAPADIGFLILLLVDKTRRAPRL